MVPILILTLDETGRLRIRDRLGGDEPIPIEYKAIEEESPRLERHYSLRPPKMRAARQRRIHRPGTFGRAGRVYR